MTVRKPVPRKTTLMITLPLLALSCTVPVPLAEEAVGGWEGTVEETEGLRTVTTTGGAVWPGEGRLLEEVAIGTETRGELDLLARVMAMDLAEREIFILDSYEVTVRVYDWEGNHLRNIGRRGEGPGEFSRPTDMGIDFRKGHLITRESVAAVLNTFSLAGEYISRRPALVGTSTRGEELLLRITNDGEIFIPTWMYRYGPNVPGGLEQGWIIYKVDSLGAKSDSLPLPAFEYRENVLEAHPDPRSIRPQPVPFAPQYIWTLSWEGEFISGYPDEYAFEIQHGDGTRTVIRREVEPVLVEGGEREWAREKTYGIMRDFEPGWEWVGPDIPETKAWYTHIIPDRNGRLWVLREGEGQETGDDSQPDDWKSWEGHQGWVSDWWFDVFEKESGRYLGRVPAPEGFLPIPEPVIQDDTFIGLTEDELGRPIVRRYRLEFPGAQAQKVHG